MSVPTLRPNRTLPKIYLYRDPVDFRKGHRGLGAIIEQELNHDPFSGILYGFTNRQRSRIKCLFWESNGFVLYYKALSEEKFHWPRSNEHLVSISGEQMNWLLDGYNIALMTPHKALHYEALC
jgi:transposase